MKFSTTTLGEISGGGSYGLGASASVEAVGPKFLRTTDIVTGNIDWLAVPYCEADELTLDKYRLSDGDIVISRTGANAGLTAYVEAPPVNSIFAGYLVRFKIDETKADSRFISYVLLSDSWTHYVEITRTGSAQPQFNAKLMGDFPISLPSIAVQKSCAAVLGALDDKIQANKQLSKTLEDIAQTIFQSWFIDFDPVKAKMAGEKPVGMDTATAALFPDSMEDSELGLIPKGWTITKVESLLNRTTVKGLPKSADLQILGDTLVLEQGNSVIAGFTDGIAAIQASGLEPKFVFGDHTCRMRLSTLPFSVMPNTIVLDARNISTYWAYQATLGLQSFESYRRHWMELAYKEVVQPQVDIAEVFANLVRPMYEKLDGLMIESRYLQLLRDALLPRLISGELQIPEEMLAS